MPQPLKADERKVIGGKFKAVRRRQRCWLAELARELGCSINTIRWHEMGIRMMRADMIIAAAKAMRVQPAELLPTNDEVTDESHA
jgi:transcriptional regulator with XRE-family HTH domain